MSSGRQKRAGWAVPYFLDPSLEIIPRRAQFPALHSWNPVPTCPVWSDTACSSAAGPCVQPAVHWELTSALWSCLQAIGPNQRQYSFSLLSPAWDVIKRRAMYSWKELVLRGHWCEEYCWQNNIIISNFSGIWFQRIGKWGQVKSLGSCFVLCKTFCELNLKSSSFSQRGWFWEIAVKAVWWFQTEMTQFFS